jgi:transposase
MILGFSRRIFARAYVGERLEWLLDGHERAFSHLGGRTETILYDNPRTIALDKDEKTGWVKWNETFKDRMDFYGVTVRLCRYYRAQTKGKVESGVKYVKRNALVGKRFRDLEELNEYLLWWCVNVADQRSTAPRTRSLPSALQAVDPGFDRAQPLREGRGADRAPGCHAAVEVNRYPVPSRVGRRITVRIQPTRSCFL